MAKLVATALKASQIVRNSFKVDKSNTEHVHLASIKVNTKGYRATTLTKIIRQPVRRHAVAVDMPRGYKGSFKDCKAIQVDCDCQRYKFVWNYALDLKNAAIKDRTNQEAPIETNPGLKAGGCKHAVAVLTELIQRNPSWPPKLRSSTSIPNEAGTKSGSKRDTGPVQLTTVRKK